MKEPSKPDGGITRPYRHQPSDLIPDALIIDTLLSTSQDTVYFKDVDSRFVLNGRSHMVQFGVKDPSELVGKSDADFYPEEFAKQSRQDEVLIMKTGIPIINKMEQGMNAVGQILVFSTSKYPLYDDKGKLIGTWGISRDMTKLVRAEEELAKAHAKLEALSLTDDLTGLFNQRHFFSVLETTMALFARKRLGGFSADFCLVFLDIDYFKQVNDTHGHLIGDAVLRYIAGQMMAITRSTDASFRYGGDEFAIILPDTELSYGRMLADHLRIFVEHNPVVIGDLKIPVTISLGVVVFANEKLPGDLIQKADALLYQAKNDGRNLVR